MNPMPEGRGLSLASAYPSSQSQIRRRDLWLHDRQPLPGFYPQRQMATQLPGGVYVYMLEHFTQDSRSRASIPVCIRLQPRMFRWQGAYTRTPNHEHEQSLCRRQPYPPGSTGLCLRACTSESKV